MEGARVGGLVTEIQGEGFGVGDLAGSGVGDGGLEVLGAVGEPDGFGHGVDEDEFGGGGGLVFAGQGFFEGIESGAIFGGEEGEVAVVAGEAVGGVVLGGDGAAGGSGWSRGVLGVASVGVELGGGDGAGCAGDGGEGGEWGTGFGDAFECGWWCDGGCGETGFAGEFSFFVGGGAAFGAVHGIKVPLKWGDWGGSAVVRGRSRRTGSLRER